MCDRKNSILVLSEPESTGEISSSNQQSTNDINELGKNETLEDRIISTLGGQLESKQDRIDLLEAANLELIASKYTHEGIVLFKQDEKLRIDTLPLLLVGGLFSCFGLLLLTLFLLVSSGLYPSFQFTQSFLRFSCLLQIDCFN